MTYDLFISHSSKDKFIADAICTKLEAQGLRCWMAPRDITPGREWGECILEGIQRCNILVVVLTINSNISRHVIKEVERAVNKGAIVIPFRIENITLTKSLEYFLSEIHWLDAITPPLEAHINELADTVKAIQGDKSTCGSPEEQKITRSDIDTFNDLAPDEWKRKSSNKFVHFFQTFFEEK
jgi:hypothetical protein